MCMNDFLRQLLEHKVDSTHFANLTFQKECQNLQVCYELLEDQFEDTAIVVLSEDRICSSIDHTEGKKWPEKTAKI